MNATKIGLIAAMAGGALWLMNQAKSAIDGFAVELIAFGKPAFRSSMLTVPMKVRFTNTTPVPIAIDKFYADIFIQKNDQFIKAGTIDEPVTIPPGKSDQVISPQVYLDQIFGGNLFLTTTFISQLFISNQITIRIDYSVNVKGVNVYTSSRTETLSLS